MRNVGFFVCCNESFEVAFRYLLKAFKGQNKLPVAKTSTTTFFPTLSLFWVFSKTWICGYSSLSFKTRSFPKSVTVGSNTFPLITIRGSEMAKKLPVCVGITLFDMSEGGGWGCLLFAPDGGLYFCNFPDR